MRFATALLALSVSLALQLATAPDLSEHFIGADGTFVLLNGRTDEYVRYNSTRARQRFAPCSTFKIPHIALLLESGTAPDADYELKYDPSFKQPGNGRVTSRSGRRFSSPPRGITNCSRGGQV